MALRSPMLATAEPHQRPAQSFEFTKRKKWADILLSELPDTALLVLDSDAQIQYVGPNTHDVLGWEVEDLSEKDLLDVVNDDDKTTFIEQFQNCLSSRTDLACYTRLKCKPAGKSGPEQGTGQKELLFEIRGHALFLPNDNDCKCFFLVAKPYPSRNMAALNTFLELKIENEKLTQRLRDLKAQQDVIPGSINDLSLPMHRSSVVHSPYSTFELLGSSGNTMQSPTSATATGSFGTMHTGFITSTVPGTNPRDEESEEGGKKKKQKKGNGQAQQYVCVTCGRTDSPEWRKGPRGPKTLCNACGLRWAKRSKRTDDVPIPYVQEQGQSSKGTQSGSRQTQSSSSTGSGRGRGAPVPNAALSVTPVERPANTNSVSATSQHQQHQQTQSQNQNQQQQRQGHYVSPSPTQATFAQSQMVPMPPTPTSSGPSHPGYPIHQFIASSASHQQHAQTSASAFGYMHPQTQSQSQEQYQVAYEQYHWAMNQHGDGSYQY